MIRQCRIIGSWSEDRFVGTSPTTAWSMMHWYWQNMWTKTLSMLDENMDEEDNINKDIWILTVYIVIFQHMYIVCGKGLKEKFIGIPYLKRIAYSTHTCTIFLGERSRFKFISFYAYGIGWHTCIIHTIFMQHPRPSPFHSTSIQLKLFVMRETAVVKHWVMVTLSSFSRQRSQPCWKGAWWSPVRAVMSAKAVMAARTEAVVIVWVMRAA